MSLIGISGKIGSGKDTVALMIQWLSSSYIQEKVPVMEDYILSDRNHKILDQKWQIKRFADKLKDIVCILIGCTREQLEDRKFKEKPLGEEWTVWTIENSIHTKLYASKEECETALHELAKHDFDTYEVTSTDHYTLTPRKLMQLIGTECGRQILHPNVWVNALFAEYRCGGWDDGYKWMSCACEGRDECDYSNRYTPKWIIPDTRFPNEAQAIRDRGGVLIRVERSAILRLHPDKCPECQSKDVYYERMGNEIVCHDCEWCIDFNTRVEHASETSLDVWGDWNFKLNNNGTIEELFEQVKEIYSEIEK